MPPDGVEKMCFVIMPFSKTSPEHTESYWTKHWRILKRKIEECPNVVARRSDPLRGDILRNIITDLYRADIVVADLTDRNPNVYWELGVRQSFKHGTITIAETRKHIPFNMLMKSTLKYYPHDSMKNEEFVEKFKKAIMDCIEHPTDPDSQVLETLGGRGTLYQLFHKDETIRRVQAILSETTSNQTELLRWYQLLEEDKGKKLEEHRIPTVPLPYSATELLVVNRYLDENPDFYRKAENYLNWIKALNSILPTWRQGLYDETEKWCFKNKDVFLGLFKEFKEIILDIFLKLTGIQTPVNVAL